MDEQLILTAVTLRLNPRVRRASPAPKVLVLKRGSSGSHLTVSDKQWEVLRQFLNPITVPEVIRVLLLNRACVPLREFYELILKAHRAGILVTELEDEYAADEGWRWWAFPGSVFVVPGAAAVAVVVLWLVLNPFPVPLDWEKSWGLVALGALATSFALSVGDILAAMALAKAGVNPPAPHFEWKTLCPHLGVDRGDVVMVKPWKQFGVWAAKMLPLSAVILGLVAFQPLCALFAILTFLLLLRPFGNGSLMPILSSLFRGYVLDTHKGVVFSLNKGLKARAHFAFERINKRYVFVRFLYAAAWIGLILYILFRLIGPNVGNLYQSVGYWLQVGRYAAAVLVTGLVLVGAPPVVRAVYRRVVKAGWLAVQFFRRWLSDTAEYSSHAAILHTMGDSPVFRRLGQIGRLGLVVAGHVQRFRPWRTLDSSKGTLPVGMILSGHVAVFRETGNGKWQRLAEYHEGDIIGSESWSDPDGGPVRVRTLSPLILLTWSPEIFGRQIFSVLGAQLATDLMVKVPFLRNLRICREWHPQALVRFAQISRLSQFAPDTRVITEGESVLWFFVIYTGRVVTRKKRLRRATLKGGDYFGEMSLLRQDVASADVITMGPTRCVLIHRPEFMRFMTHNPSVALELEKVSSHRLGRPVFPYKP